MESWSRIKDIRTMTEAQKSAAIEEGVQLPGYKFVKKMPGQDWAGGWFVRETADRGNVEAYRAALPRPKYGDMREFLPARATQLETFGTIDLEQVQVSEIEDVATGVIGAGVVIGSLRPHANRPGAWNLMSHRTATLDEGFSSLVLPNPVKLSEMLISAAKRADITGGETSDGDQILTDTPDGGDIGQQVIRDDGITISANAPASHLTSPIASVLKDEIDLKDGWSVEGTAICDHDGMTGLADHLRNIAGNPNNNIRYEGIKWAGMLQSSLPSVAVTPAGQDPAQAGTMRVTIPGHTILAFHENGDRNPAGDIVLQGHNGVTVVEMAALPDPEKWVAGNTDNTIDNPPLTAVVDLLIIFERDTSPMAPATWKIMIFATRRS